MTENKIINYGLLITKSIYWLCILFFTGLTVSLIYWHLQADAFSQIDMSDSFKAGYGINDLKIIKGEKPAADAVLLSELNPGMVYWIYIRGAFFFLMTFLIIKKTMSVLRSINKVRTFYEDNIYHFRDLARLGFIAFAVSCVNFAYLNGELQINLGLEFAPLFFSVACLVLAEVFREGKELLEDNNMII